MIQGGCKVPLFYDTFSTNNGKTFARDTGLAIAKLGDCTLSFIAYHKTAGSTYLIFKNAVKHSAYATVYFCKLGNLDYHTLAHEFQGFRVWGKFVFRTLELMDTPTNLANQVKVGHALDQSCSVQSRGPERAHQNKCHHGDRRRQIADFVDSCETTNWLYLLFESGIKTKTFFEWLLWHWSSLGQLNLEPTRPNGLLDCKVPIDLVKISVKKATHMGFHYTSPLPSPGHCGLWQNQCHLSWLSWYHDSSLFSMFVSVQYTPAHLQHSTSYQLWPYHVATKVLIRWECILLAGSMEVTIMLMLHELQAYNFVILSSRYLITTTKDYCFILNIQQLRQKQKL